MKRLFLCMCIMISGILNALPFSVPKVHYFQVVYPATIAMGQAMPILFKGNDCLLGPEQQGSPQRALFELYDATYLTDIYLLVTTGLSRPTSLEVTRWQTSADYPYRLFHASARPYTGTIVSINDQDISMTGTSFAPIKKVSDSLWEWVVEELDNTKPVIDVPDTTIILFTEPSWVTVRSTLFDKEHPFRMLPSIVFGTTLDSETFADKMNEMACQFPDYKPWHKKKSKGIAALANSQTVVTLPVHSKSYRVS